MVCVGVGDGVDVAVAAPASGGGVEVTFTMVIVLLYVSEAARIFVVAIGVEEASFRSNVLMIMTPILSNKAAPKIT